MTNQKQKFQEVLKKARSSGTPRRIRPSTWRGLTPPQTRDPSVAGLRDPGKNGGYLYEGISSINPMDIEYAKELGYAIKLLAIAKSDGGAVEARVHPTLLPADHLLATVGGPFNAIFVKGDAVGSTMFYAPGPDDAHGKRRDQRRG